MAAVPLLLVLALTLAFTFVIIPMMDTAYLALPACGETVACALRGVWSIMAALTLPSLALVVLVALGTPIGRFCAARDPQRGYSTAHANGGSPSPAVRPATGRNRETPQGFH